MKTEIEWMLCKDKLPEESGDYLVVFYGESDFLHFSKRYNCFNAHDRDTREQAYNTGVQVEAWATVTPPDFEREEI
jgi:hypothetical protein